MNYDTMKAAELKALCELRGITPHRAKAVMIADLKARDAFADELTKLGQELDASDGGLPASEDVPDLGDHLDLTKPVETDVWRSEDSFYKRYDAEGPYLGNDEHEENLRDVVDTAKNHHLTPYGPPFRVADKCGVGYWVYAVNVRQK